MKRIALGVLSLLVAIIVRGAAPDFAFPDKVNSQARAGLVKDIAEGNGPGAMRNLMDCILATEAIDTDSINSVLNLIDVTSARIKSPSFKGMCHLLKAEVLASVYTSDRYGFDRRELPEADVPADVAAWSGGQFRAAVAENVDSALAMIPVTEPIGKWLGVTTLDSGDIPLYPSLYDFAAYRAIELLGNVDRNGSTVAINAIYGRLLKVNAGNAAAEVNARVSRICREFPVAMNDSLLAIAGRYAGSPYGAEALIPVNISLYSEMSPTDIERWHRLVDMIDSRLRTYPGYVRNNCLRNRLNNLTQPMATIRSRSVVSPDDTLRVELTDFNSPVVRIDVYRVPTSVAESAGDYRLTAADLAANRYMSVEVAAPDTLDVPFLWKDTVDIPPLPYGRYIIVPVAKGCDKQVFGDRYSIVRSTRLAGIATAYARDNRMAVADIVDGTPVAGARVTARNNRGSALWSRTTGRDGEICVPSDGDSGFHMYIAKGKDRYASPVYEAWSNRKPGPRAAMSVTAFTSLPLYHPGDTVRYAAVVQSAYGSTARPMPNIRIRTIVRDPNNQAVDTTEAVTDAYGRITGSVVLPVGQLTGEWTLTFTQPGNNRYLGRKSFMTSDYRLPQYKVDISDIVRHGDVDVKGQATTYTGFPVADGRAALTVTAVRRLWWRWYGGEETVLWRDTVATGADGVYAFTVADSVFRKSPWSDAVIKTEVSLTAPDGEVVTATRSFAMGPQYNLNVQLPEAIDASAPLKLNYTLSDLDGHSIAAPLNVTVYSHGKQVGRQEVSDGMLDISGYASGRYSLVFQPVDTTLASATDSLVTVVYRPGDTLSPLPAQLLWTPATYKAAAADGRATVQYALGNATGWVHYALTTDSVLIDRGAVNAGSGMHTMPVTLPDGVDNAILTLWAVGNYDVSSVQVTVERDKVAPALTVEIESMRDRLVPGATERWTVRITDQTASPVKAALILNMFAKSITTLRPQTLSLSALLSQSVARFSINSSLGNRIYESIAAQYKTLDCKEFNNPDFQTYGQSFYPRFTHNLRMYKAEATVARALGGAVPGMAVEQKMAMNSYASADMAMADEVAEAEADDADGGDGAAPEAEDVKYREAEVPLALFEPTLSTDADGTTVVSFTVPDANTTWQLLGLAYDKDMTIGTMQRDMIASKPLMVRPNLPRFLRQGDRAEVIANVMNATDSTIVATTVVETFDPVSRAVLSTWMSTDTVAGGESRQLATRITAAEVGLLGYRVRTSALGFADAEQTLLPVLAATQPVVKSTPFYFDAEAATATVSVPGGDNVSVIVNNSPVWSVFTALPGLVEKVEPSATSATAALFGAAVADRLLSAHPWLRQGLDSIAANPGDSVLVSALQRNASLKTLMLGQTPWVSRAMSETERMARLVLLLDSAQVDKTLGEAVEVLSKLQRSGGGLAWRTQYAQPSEWMTRDFLSSVARLNSLGYRTADARLSAIVDRALSYCDSLVAIELVRNAKATDLNYVAMRYRFDRPQDKRLRAVTDNTLAWLRKDWRSLSLADKACAAMVLDHYGDHKLASTIMESVLQYSVKAKTLGAYFPSLAGRDELSSTAIILDALLTVVPDDKSMADAMTQWLLLQKDARNWGTSRPTTDIVSTLLSRYDGATADYSGAPSQTIAAHGPATINLDKRAGQPLWGAVVEQKTELPSKVKAHSTADLSIGKRLYKQMPDGSWRETTTFEVGDIVQVSLTVKAGRAMDCVAITDPRAAAFQPVDQLPGNIYAESLAFYRESNDAATNIFIDHLPKGTYVLSYRLTANNAGLYTSGIATIQSQYSPGETANSAAPDITVNSTNQY